MSYESIGITSVIAAFGGIAIGWRHLTDVFTQIRSLIIITNPVELASDRTKLATYAVLNEKFYFPYLANKLYSITGMRNSNRVYINVLLKQKIYNRSFVGIYKKTLSPVFIHMDHDLLTITYFRFTFDIEKLLKFIYEEVSDISNKIKDTPRPRFGIKHMWGSFGNAERNNHNKSHNMEDSIAEVSSLTKSNIITSLNINYDYISCKAVDIISDNKEDFNDKSWNKSQCDDMDSLFLTEEQHKLDTNINKFLEGRDWYLERRLPWKRGYLLYGPPGTGKSSLVYSMGRKYNLPIKVFHLETFKNKELVDAYRSDPKGSIILIEDIDTIFDKRKNLREGELERGLSFDTLLNVIDGIDNNQGILLFITTNHPEKLDNALGGFDKKLNKINTRPGRIDESIEMSYLCRDGVEFITNKILKNICKYDKDAFIDRIISEHKQITGAQVQELCIKEALNYYWNDDNNN